MITYRRRTGWGLLIAAVAVSVTACGFGGDGPVASPVGTGTSSAGTGSSSTPMGRPSVPTGQPSGTASSTPSQPPQQSSSPRQSPSSPGSGSSQQSDPAPSGTKRAPLATAQEMLSHHLHQGQDEYVVAVRSGYDGIIFDNVGHVTFMHSDDGMDWIYINDSTYRYDKRDAAGQTIKVTGRVPQRADHATFLLTGTFTGDGTGRMMAFSYGGKAGWGAVVAQGKHADDTRRFVDQVLPGPDSYDQVSYFHLKFSHGYLVESDCSSREVATCGARGTLTTSWWLWDPHELDFRSAQ